MQFSDLKKMITVKNAGIAAVSILVVLVIIYILKMLMKKDGFNTLARAFGQKAPEPIGEQIQGVITLDMAPTSGSMTPMDGSMMPAGSMMPMDGSVTPMNGSMMPAGSMTEKNYVASNARSLVPQDLVPFNARAADFDKEFPSTNVENNFLVAGHHIGINTVSSSLKNANTQIRSDPYVPVVPTGLWNQSTITPDLNRRKLEIDDCAKM